LGAFAFGFGHRFCTSFIVLFEGIFSQVLFGFILETSFMFYGGFFRGRRSSAIFLSFACASSRICLGKWCTVWVDFLLSYSRHEGGYFISCEYPSLLMVGLSFILFLPSTSKIAFYMHLSLPLLTDIFNSHHSILEVDFSGT
jgi:hypothetical protein